MGVKYNAKKQVNLCFYEFYTRNEIVFTIIPQYLRPARWTAEFNNLRDLLEEKTIIKPIIIGDLNSRIGKLDQEINEIYKELFAAGTEVRNQKTLILIRKVDNY